MIREQFNEIYFKNRYIREKILNGINNVLSLVEFSKNSIYKIGLNPETDTHGIYIYLFGKWRWSWMNSINTNYSCLYQLIDEVNGTESRKILESDLLNNTDETLEYFFSILLKNKQTYFTPGSKVFKKMFFDAQYTWSVGTASLVSDIVTISKNFDVEQFNMDYHRGTKDDMSKGCDLKIYLDGRRYDVQHKKCNLEDKGGYFVSNNFIYNNKTYKHVDLISIESKDKIYLFHNSEDKNLCGKDDRGYFKIYKTLLIKPMYKENQEVSNLLIELIKVCGRKEIIYEFERGNGKQNYFEDKTKDSVKSLRFFLNDLHDENLVNIIKEQLEKLK